MIERKIKIYPKTIPQLRTVEEKWGVDPLPREDRIHKKVLILGTGRCGTTFTWKALSTVGLDVTHEKVGRDGAVSHYFVTDSKWYPMAPGQVKKGKVHVGERRSDFIFETVMHIVRDPRKSIPSIANAFSSVTWDFYLMNGLITEYHKDKRKRAMELWVNHNRSAISQSSYTFKLEEYASAWPEMMEMLGKSAAYPSHLKAMNKHSGYRKYDPWQWDDFAKLDADLADRVLTLSNELGYL